MRKEMYVITYFGAKEKEPEVIEGLPLLLDRVRELTKKKCLFTVRIVGECVVDYS